ncbi:cytochrome c5 family protein [Proteobacteria bacterium 005FR1]|nr:cytochrome c5 family protein [Proteobacteria bacterium 005FR1]
MPADPQLAELYRYSCKACHAVPASSAPLTGDMEAWKPRMAKGVDVLVQHAIEGFGGMPPLGFCMECSRAELAALIIFMASPPAQ